VETPQWQRRQTTVMSADVAGYSRMMADNDLSTLRALLECLEQIANTVRSFGGRVVDTVGDNLLAEFPTQVAALRCASHVQLWLIERNQTCSPSAGMHFRIGLHSGSLLCSQGRLYGDVVNLSARLQNAAEPGHVLLSQAVLDGLDEGLERSLIDRGTQRFKNIPYAVQTFETPHRFVL
jgi:adenylate cyclase